MTVIAANLQEMSCDSMAADGFADFEVKKIHIVGGYIVGFCGDLVGATKFLKWLKSPPDEKGVKKEPEREEHEYVGEGFEALVLGKDGLHLFANAFVPFKLEESNYAIGAGGQAARAAMMMGKTTREAVDIACRVTPSTCRPPIRTVKLADVLAAEKAALDKARKRRARK